MGSSSRQGGHQVAMKLTHSGWPRRAVVSTSEPPSCASLSGGARSPTVTPTAGTDEPLRDGTTVRDGDAPADGDAPGPGLDPGI